MGQETSKCYARRRERHDFKRYLTGEGIDIGCGDDPLLVEEGSVRGYDRLDGDALYMTGIGDESYDFVYSSHCLEHMSDVKLALTNWLRILRPGGILYVVVPDFELYEKKRWPSRYNPDHKASFSLSIRSERLNHYLIRDLVFWLDRERGVSTLEAHLENAGFDPARFEEDQTEMRNGGALCQIYFVGYKRPIRYSSRYGQSGSALSQANPSGAPCLSQNNGGALK
jgi:SAM-dependent methyltransferase